MSTLPSLLLALLACAGGPRTPQDSAPGTDGGTPDDSGTMPELQLCGVAVFVHGQVLDARIPADRALHLQWSYELESTRVPLGELQVEAGAPAALPLMGFPDGSLAQLEVSADGCTEDAALAITAPGPAPLGDLLRTKGTGVGLEAELWLLPVISTAGAGIMAFNADGRVVWNLPVPAESEADPQGDAGAYVGAFPRIRRVHLHEGTLVQMVEALEPGQGCTFREQALAGDGAGSDPVAREIPADCHHDFSYGPGGEQILPVWDPAPYAENSLLVDRIVSLAPGATAVQTLVEVKDHVDISELEVAALEAFAAGSPSGDVTNLTYVNGGGEELRSDGSVSWWLVNLVEDGILRIARDRSGAVTEVSLITDDPKTSDYVLELGEVFDQLILGPHGIACMQDEEGLDTCFLHNRGFEFLHQPTDPSCTSVTAFQLDPATRALTLLWHSPVLDSGGQCLPSYVHGNVTLAQRDSASLVSTLASGAFTLIGKPGPTRPVAWVVHDHQGTLQLQLETPIPDAETVRMIGFLSGPYDSTRIAAEALDATRAGTTKGSRTP